MKNYDGIVPSARSPDSGYNYLYKIGCGHSDSGEVEFVGASGPVAAAPVVGASGSVAVATLRL